MNNSGNILVHLRELEESERLLSRLPKGAPQPADLVKNISSLRTQIPPAVLDHYSSRKARGKRTVAPVRNGVCGACHLALPVGSAFALRAAGQLHICDHCGAFIYLADEQTPAASSPIQPLKTTRRAPPKKRAPKELQTA